MVVLLATFLLPAHTARGLILAPSDIDTTVRPPDDPGWDYVGRRGNASAVYLGNRWVITAFHVGAGTVNLGSTNYRKEVGNGVQLQNPPGFGLTDFTDLRMFRLEEEPPLPPLPISLVAPPISGKVTLVGYGRTRSGPLTSFSVDNTGAWVETADASIADYAGFKIGGSGKRWGTNHVESAGRVTTNKVDVLSLRSTFDRSALSETEARAAGGDSGSGVFYKRGGTWYLTGIVQSVSTTSGQPANVAAYGDKTNFADLSLYRNQIIDIMQRADATTPPPWQNPLNVLNVNADSIVSPLDVLSIVNELNRPAISDPRTGRLPSVRAGTRPPPYLDVDGNGIVTPLDALRIVNELNRVNHVVAPKRSERPTGLTSTSVPEPATDLLWAMAILALLGTRGFDRVTVHRAGRRASREQ